MSTSAPLARALRRGTSRRALDFLAQRSLGRSTPRPQGPRRRYRAVCVSMKSCQERMREQVANLQRVQPAEVMLIGASERRQAARRRDLMLSVTSVILRLLPLGGARARVSSAGWRKTPARCRRGTLLGCELIVRVTQHLKSPAHRTEPADCPLGAAESSSPGPLA